MKIVQFLRFALKPFPGILLRQILFSALILAGTVLLAEGLAVSKKDPASLLRKIHLEVKEMGFYADENFLRREFHMNLDGNDTNKEEYVMVFSQKIEDREKMLVQVTYFEPEKNNRFVKHAKETREIECNLRSERIEIKKCDYEEKALWIVLNEILRGIRSKKELLKLIGKNIKNCF